ncbi:MAG: CoA-binding protein [Candidatus Marinimicrobia bacterium]|nr:CoA-binding protein [Candidatus Neomarinimicrobiota bacterium]
MYTITTIDDFLGHKALAFAGASRSGRKFVNTVYRDLKKKGYQLHPVHPQAQTVEGDPCYHSIAELPPQIGGLFICVAPDETGQLVRQAHEAGIRHIWLQQGAASEDAIRFCDENSISLIHGECILMFAEPAHWLHRTHRWCWKLLGKLPE